MKTYVRQKSDLVSNQGKEGRKKDGKEQDMSERRIETKNNKMKKVKRAIRSSKVRDLSIATFAP